MPWGRREFSLDRSDSEEFLGCFFSFAGSPKHQLRAPGRRVCPLAVAIGGGVAPVEPGASVDSQIALCGCAVCGLTPREAVAMIMSYLRMGADPLDSLDCSTFARGCACSCGGCAARRAARGCGGSEVAEVAKKRQQNLKAVQFS